MACLQIDTGAVILDIVTDGVKKGVFKFNPTDILVAKKFYALSKEFDAKQAEMSQKYENAKTEEEKLDIYSQFVQYFRDCIDSVYGDGTSNLLFGDAMTCEMLVNFFDAIVPYYEKASKDRINKYVK